MTITIGPRLSRRAFVAATGAAAAAALVPAAAQTSGALQIWFVRHAESEINVPGSPRPVPDGGVSYPLTRKGVEQAKALAEATAATPILAIYTSTYLRAVQTADALAFRHDLTLRLAPEAVEIDLGIKPGSGEDPRAVYLELARKWTVDRDLEARHGEGESFTDVQRRFLPFVREVMNRHAQDSGVVAIVAHAATIGFMLPVLASNVPADYAVLHPLPNTGIVRTELRDSRLFCLDWLGIPAEELKGQAEA
ncbi:MAG TPA: histidine phosphatase family protein [Steroidobacteraceae bacterium]|nr:histidine phosphatase family protein [Steroidobacteraceae bacterium]